MGRFVELFRNKSKYVIFFGFFFLYFTLGLAVTFQNQCIVENCDLMFGADCPRVYFDFFNVLGGHERIHVHPLQLIVFQPIMKIVDLFVNSHKITLLVMNSIVVSSILLLVKSICFQITNKKGLSLLTALTLGCSFSSLFFVSIPETYIYGALLNLLLLHYLISLHKEDVKITTSNFCIISALSVFSFGIIPVNLIICLIMIITFFYYQCRRELKNCVNYLLKVVLLILVLYLTLSLLQKLAFPSAPMFFQDIAYKEFGYMTKGLDFTNRIKYLLPNVVHSFYFIDTETNNLQPNPRNICLVVKFLQDPIKYIPIFLLFVGGLLTYMFNFKKSPNKYIAPLFVIELILFTGMYFYGTREAFIYSFNYMPLLLLLVSSMYGRCKDIIIQLIFGMFIIYQIFANLQGMNYIINFASVGEFKHYSIVNWAIYSLIITLFFALLVYVAKNILKNNKYISTMQNKYKYYLVIYFVYMLLFGIMTALFHGRV